MLRMTDQSDLRHLPEAIAVPHRRMRVSAVWIIPILAALVALGIAIHRVWSEGPTITILFDAAQGIEAGKTFVKYKDVKIGQVTAVQLSEEPGKVEVTAKIARSAARLMVEDAQFWVVRPRIGLSEISGLATLLSGNYIGFEAGTSNNERRSFTGSRFRASSARMRRGGNSCSRRATCAGRAQARPSITATCRLARSSPSTSRLTARRSMSRYSSTPPMTST